MSTATVLTVSLSPKHTFSKLPQSSIHLLAGRGVEGDAHCGATVQHRFLRRRNPAAPNRLQVHLLAAEFLATVAKNLSDTQPILPGDLGENVTTRALDLLALPLGTTLHLGAQAIVELTGLRSPCKLMNKLRPGLMQAAFHPGTRSPRAGVMAIVLQSGVVESNDLIHVTLPTSPHLPLRPI